MHTPAPLRFQTLDVFTDTPFSGNPLAVVSGGQALTRAQMQAIAREFNLSETVFVLPPTRPGCRHRLRIFTPASELPFAGHPTIGAACLLAEPASAPSEQSFSLEENIGAVRVRVRHTSQQPAYAELSVAQLPQHGTAPPPSAVLATALGLEAGDLGRADDPYGVFSCGVPFLLVPLRAPELLAGIEIDAQRLRTALGAEARGVYVYARGYEGELRARMFAPGLGVAEDPATGSAAAALAGALGLLAGDGHHAWCIHQGVEMGRSSQLYIRAEHEAGALTAVHVGGHAVLVGEGTLRHP